MVDIDKLVSDFHENHEVKYTFMAEVDGEVVAKQTSSSSADDVSGFGWLIDERVQKLVLENEEHKND